MKIQPVRFCLFLLVLCASVLPCRAQDPLGQWIWRNPLPAGGSGPFTGAAYGTNQYVAVGPPGTILTSPDGVNWTSRASGVFTPLNAVVYGGNQFVAVGGDVTLPAGAFLAISNIVVADVILTSPDGVFWTYHTSGGSDVLKSITFGNNQYVAVGSDSETQLGVIVTSPDGATWTRSSSLTNDVLLGVGFGNNQFVATGYNSDILSGSIHVSADGINWTNCPVGLASAGYALDGVAYGSGQFVAAGGPEILSSSDGLNWTNRSNPATLDLNAVTYGNDQFVAAGFNEPAWAAGFLTSPDGITWTAQVSDSGDDSQGITYGGGLFVATGWNYQKASATILNSPDGATWTDPFAGSSAGTDYVLTAVAARSNLLVAAGYYLGAPHTGVILTSQDGAAWTSQTSGAASFLNGVASGNGQFVAVGDKGVIVTSSDGTNWTNRGATATSTNSALPFPPLSSAGPYLLAAAFGSGQFVAVGYDIYGGASPILTSSDGVVWTNRSSGASNLLSAVTWGGGQFVAVGRAGVVLTSPDGATWTSASSGSTNDLSAVTYGNGLYVAAGGTTILSSPDGVTWTDRSSAGLLFNGDGFTCLAWGDGQFAAASSQGEIATSADGLNWTNRATLLGAGLFGAAFSGDTFVVVGERGSILQSSVLATPRLALTSAVPGGRASLLVKGKPGRPYAIQGSPDLFHWVTMTNLILRSTAGQLVDPAGTSYPQRFYRIVPQ